jgi:hypothetical protein
MRAGKILPCICSPNWEEEHFNNGFYGMPVLRTWNGEDRFFDCICPKCGRGGLEQFKSPYLALRDWNLMQKELREPECPFKPADGNGET